MKFSLQPDFQLQSLQKLAEVKYTVILLCINEITAKKKITGAQNTNCVNCN